MKKSTLLRAGNVIAFLATAIMNGLANTLPLNGLETGEISDRFEIFFVPAGYVFSIWGIIYLALAGFAVYQALPGQRDNEKVDRIGVWFILSCVANVIWLFLWHYEVFNFTLLAMVALLITLIVIYLRIEVGRGSPTLAERLFIQIPFQIYLGWITVATIANVTQLLFFLNWDGFGVAPEIWTVIMLVVAGIVASIVSFTRRDIPYVLVLIWALVGIAIKHAGTQLVMVTAYAVAGALAIVALISALRRPRMAQRD